MRNIKWLVFGTLIILAIVLSACKPNIKTMDELETSFQDTLDTFVSNNKNIHNAVVMVQGPDFVWKGASGMADPEAELEMLPDDQFRLASAAKMMLATLSLKLSEQGLFSLDDPIANYLSSEIIDGLHVYDGHDYSNEITILNLLHHTSGLPDNWTDERDDEKFIHIVLEEDPDKLWEPYEVVEYIKENLSPLFAPGEKVNYSDVNFILMGMVIESLTGEELHEVYQEQLFGPLGMEHTYMEWREDARPSIEGRSISHVFYEDIDYTDNRSISADWAGGGLVSTTEDMNIFMQAFVNNEIFSDPQTRDRMFDWMDLHGETIQYGLGMMKVQGKTLLIWGHLGTGNALMFYWPDGDVIITGTLNQKDADGGAFISKILKAIESYQNNN